MSSFAPASKRKREAPLDYPEGAEFFPGEGAPFDIVCMCGLKLTSLETGLHRCRIACGPNPWLVFVASLILTLSKQDPLPVKLNSLMTTCTKKVYFKFDMGINLLTTSWLFQDFICSVLTRDFDLSPRGQAAWSRGQVRPWFSRSTLSGCGLGYLVKGSKGLIKCIKAKN